MHFISEINSLKVFLVSAMHICGKQQPWTLNYLTKQSSCDPADTEVRGGDSMCKELWKKCTAITYSNGLKAENKSATQSFLGHFYLLQKHLTRSRCWSSNTTFLRFCLDTFSETILKPSLNNLEMFHSASTSCSAALSFYAPVIYIDQIQLHRLCKEIYIILFLP